LLHLPTLKAGALLFFILNKVSLIDHNMKLLSVELTTEQARFCSKLWSWVIVAAFSVEKTNLFFFLKKKKKNQLQPPHALHRLSHEIDSFSSKTQHENDSSHLVHTCTKFPPFRAYSFNFSTYISTAKILIVTTLCPHACLTQLSTTSPL